MKNIIVGTAGHIDHGKTTLVKALTGTDADRLAEEKRRGITIDLGFAHLQLTPEIRLGFIDVPGHERFIKNMLAGVGGIDLVLLVIAADESIKPQTREHFDICRLLGIRRGIVVMTKADLVPPDLIELVQLEVEEFTAGSFLDGAPVIPVSSTTGSGIDRLRDAILNEALHISERNTNRPARLPIDRAFSMRGFGTVVTGTLLSGTLTRDQEIELLPSRRTLRVRGLQVYGAATARAEAGTRTAINLADIETGAIARGMVLAEKSRFEAASVADCEIELLASAKRLKNRAPVHFHSGSIEVEARVRLIQRASLEPEARCYARLTFSEPVVLAPGDRFIVRQFSPVITIGGGSVIDVRPPRERRAARIESRLRTLAGGDDVAKVILLLEESAFGLALDDIARRLNLYPAQVLELARQARAIAMKDQGWMVGAAWLQGQRKRLLDAVQAHHKKSPLQQGISRHDLKARIFLNAPAFLLDAALAGTPELISDADHVRHRSHRVTLNVDEEGARQKIVTAFEKAGLAVPSVAEVLAGTGLDAARSQTLLRMLLKENILIRVSDDLVFHRSAIANLRVQLAQHRNASFTVSAFKEWTGVSRKYAVPLLEFLDREHVTLRTGDLRVVV